MYLKPQSKTELTPSFKQVANTVRMTADVPIENAVYFALTLLKFKVASATLILKMTK